MTIITNGNNKILKADDGKLLRDKNDVGETIIDPITGEEIFIPPYDVKVIYLGKQIQTLEEAQELYEEVEE